MKKCVFVRVCVCEVWDVCEYIYIEIERERTTDCGLLRTTITRTSLLKEVGLVSSALLNNILQCGDHGSETS